VEVLQMESFRASIDDVIAGRAKSPLAVEVIPNYMGINLCAVDSLEWKKKPDGQLVSFTIHFIPA